jgi:hypothetical protein
MLSSGEEPTARGLAHLLYVSDISLTTLLEGGTGVGGLSAEAHGQESLGHEGREKLRNELSA